MYPILFNLVWILHEVNCGKPIIGFLPVELGNDSEESLKIIKTFPDGAIIVDINLPNNGLKESMILKPFFKSDADQNHNHCNYVGELQSDKKATVSVSGCIGREDVITSITSDTHSNMTHIWKLYGVVEEVKNPRPNLDDAVDGFDEFETTSNGLNLDKVETTTIETTTEEFGENLDEVESSTDGQDDQNTINGRTNHIPIPKVPIDHIECAMKLKGNIQGLIPPDLTLQLTVNYDDTFLESFNHNKAKAEASIREAITQAQPIFLDTTLGTKVHLKTVGDFKHWSGERLHATDENMYHFSDMLKKANPDPDLLSNPYFHNATHVMFTNYTECNGDESKCASGQAFLGSACISTPFLKPNSRYELGQFLPSVAIIERNPGSSYGWLLAHELGHVLGMDHDAKWEESNERPVVPKGYCNDAESGKLSNIMRNLLAPKRRTWSICNRCDLLITYQTDMFHYGYYCLAPKNKSNSLRNTYF